MSVKADPDIEEAKSKIQLLESKLGSILQENKVGFRLLRSSENS